MKRLIVTADDFGLTRGVNSAVIEAFKKRIITSASLLVNSQFMKEAIVLAKENPGLDVGLHLSLADNRPILPSQQVSTIIDRSGNFSLSHLRVIKRLLLSQIDLKQIEAEFEAQIRLFLSMGIKLVHINSHGYIHAWPTVLPIVIRLAERYGVRALRVPKEQRLWKRPKLCSLLLREHVKIIGFDLLGRINERRIGKCRLFIPAATFEIPRSENDLFGNLKARFINIIEGVTEFCCHPMSPGEEAADNMGWHYRWEEIAKALGSPQLQTIIDREKIVLTSYRDIVK